MNKTFETENFGTVTVRNAMIDDGGTYLIEGIEITGDDIELTEVPTFYDIDELTIDEVESLIETYI